MTIRNFQHIGQKQTQEDAYFISGDQRLLLVCDGVGGHHRGDFASKALVDKIEALYENSAKPNQLKDLKRLISEAIKSLEDLTFQDPLLKGSSSTLALLYLLDNMAFSAHIGDSRIIMINENCETPWATKDHSIVQELYDAGILESEEDMRLHPYKNRITKAITAGADMSDEVVYQEISNLAKQNYFILCTDGLMEHFTNNDIQQLIDSLGSQKAYNLINQKCKEHSKDNATVIWVDYERGC